MQYKPCKEFIIKKYCYSKEKLNRENYLRKRN